MYAWEGREPWRGGPGLRGRAGRRLLRNFDRTKNASFVEKQAYRFRLLPDGDYVRLTCFSIDLGGIKGRIKPEGFTVNDYLAAALFLAIALGVQIPKGAPDVSLSIPINLRPFFGSVTQRNFSYYVNVRIPVVADMEQALRCIHRQVREATQRDRLLSGIAATVKTANHIFIRYTPRVVKEFMIRRVYRVIAGTGMTDNAIESWISEAGAGGGKEAQPF